MPEPRESDLRPLDRLLSDAAAAFRDGRLDDAAALCRRAAGAGDAFGAAVLAARSLAEGRGADWQDAAAAYQVALAVGEESGADDRALAVAYNELGGLCMDGGDPESAAEVFARAIAREPSFADAHANLGGVLADQGRHEEALAALQGALALRPDHTGYLAVVARELRMLRRDDEAAAVYARWHVLAPDDPVAAHHASARNAPAARASAEYVRREFDALAEQFDDLLVKGLEYRTPEQIESAARTAFGERARDLDVGDLGCGTGLCGPLLRPMARRLVGVDLSPAMLKRAVDRGYDERVEADIVEYCLGAGGAFDLLVASDVFNYFGELAPVLRAAHGALRPGGALVFSVERDDAPGPDGWAMRVDGRYRHEGAALDARLREAGYTDLRRDQAVLRLERGLPVEAWIVTARRAG